MPAKALLEISGGSPGQEAHSSSTLNLISPTRIHRDPLLVGIIEGRFITAGDAVGAVTSELIKLKSKKEQIAVSLEEFRRQEKLIMEEFLRLMERKQSFDLRGGNYDEQSPEENCKRLDDESNSPSFPAPSPPATTPLERSKTLVRKVKEYQEMLDQNNLIKDDTKKDLRSLENKISLYEDVIGSMRQSMKRLGLKAIGDGSPLPRSLFLGHVPLSAPRQRMRDIRREVVEIIFHHGANAAVIASPSIPSSTRAAMTPMKGRRRVGGAFGRLRKDFHHHQQQQRNPCETQAAPSRQRR
mmetsp:Transcript_14927/g.23780  ORF Transcript_14927/g.23780 Transcript_14927/m.23780 type:complete len:298 (+) Transcript_14927:112-1005(+)